MSGIAAAPASARQIADALTFADAIAALRAAFTADIAAPLRHHHEIAEHGDTADMLLIMPAWHGGAHEGPRHAGIKLVTVLPENAAAGRRTVQGVYVLFDAETGAVARLIDGTALTLWRTAAASALAADYLARKDASRMVMAGAGALAPYMVRAHMAVRGYTDIVLWNRTPARAEVLAQTLAGDGLPVRAVDDLEAAVREADLVSCATLAAAPVVKGAWLTPGAHLDLVGAFRPTMRESDDEAMRRAVVFVDTRAGALAEAGDIVQAIKSGALAETDIRADLFDLCRGVHKGRADADGITAFKSVGTALEDLAIAGLVHERLATGTGRA